MSKTETECPDCGVEITGHIPQPGEEIECPFCGADIAPLHPEPGDNLDDAHICPDCDGMYRYLNPCNCGSPGPGSLMASLERTGCQIVWAGD